MAVEPGVGRQRPLGGHRFRIEVDVLTVDDLDRRSLAGLLVTLTTGGLMGVLRAVGRVELDGERYDDWPEMGAEVSRILRPPPDWRVGVAANQIDEALRVLNAVLGRGLDDESDDEVADLIAGASL